MVCPRALSDQDVVELLVWGSGAQLYGIDKATKSLVFVDPSGDDDEELDLNMSLLWR